MEVTALFCTPSISSCFDPLNTRSIRMSLTPSPLKSPVPSICQSRPTAPILVMALTWVESIVRE
jgi:hypothetical protein